MKFKILNIDESIKSVVTYNVKCLDDNVTHLMTVYKIQDLLSQGHTFE